MITPMIMAGGSGTRLWPLSRSLYPRQFRPLAEKRAMLQATAERRCGLTDNMPLLACNEEHRFIAARQIHVVGLTPQILLEPVERNTAPAATLAALQATASGEDSLLSVLAADHLIEDEQGFRDTVLRGVLFAERGDMVTFGIVLTAAETGYGFIQQGAPADADSTGYRVDAFVEKPAKEKHK